MTDPDGTTPEAEDLTITHVRGHYRKRSARKVRRVRFHDPDRDMPKPVKKSTDRRRTRPEIEPI
jgi:hypothetical protein